MCAIPTRNYRFAKSSCNLFIKMYVTPTRNHTFAKYSRNLRSKMCTTHSRNHQPVSPQEKDALGIHSGFIDDSYWITSGFLLDSLGIPLGFPTSEIERRLLNSIHCNNIGTVGKVVIGFFHALRQHWQSSNWLWALKHAIPNWKCTTTNNINFFIAAEAFNPFCVLAF